MRSKEQILDEIAPMPKVTLKWRDGSLFIWPGNKMRDVVIVNGIVHPSHERRIFAGSTAWGLLGRLTPREQQLVRDGFVMVVPAMPLLDGINFK